MCQELEDAENWAHVASARGKATLGPNKRHRVTVPPRQRRSIIPKVVCLTLTASRTRAGLSSQIRVKASWSSPIIPQAPLNRSMVPRVWFLLARSSRWHVIEVQEPIGPMNQSVLEMNRTSIGRQRMSMSKSRRSMELNLIPSTTIAQLSCISLTMMVLGSPYGARISRQLVRIAIGAAGKESLHPTSQACYEMIVRDERSDLTIVILRE